MSESSQIIKKQEKLGNAPVNAGAQIVHLSLEWYRDKFYQVLKCLFISCISNIALILLIVILWVLRPEPIYFSITPDLRVMEMEHLSEPYIQNAGLTNWVAQSLTSTFSINFRNWREQLGSVRQAYDEKAFQTLVVAMKNNGILDIIDKKRLVCTVIMQTSPVIYASGLQQGKYMWRIKVPLLLNYESSESIVHRQNLQADVLVQRANTKEYPSGVNIRQIVLSNNPIQKY